MKLKKMVNDSQMFSPERSFRNKLDSLAKDICSPLKDAKYLIGYTFFDMPDLKSIRPFHKNYNSTDNGLIYPWVQDLRALPAESSKFWTFVVKQKWIEILKKNHSDAFSAGQRTTQCMDLMKLTVGLSFHHPQTGQQIQIILH